MKQHRKTVTYLIRPLALCAALTLVSTACTPRSSELNPAATPVTADQLITSLPAAERPVDEVTWAIVEGEPATLDPANSAQLITPNLCDNLLTLRPDFSVSAGLAKSAEYVDPTTLVIELRDDVLFWDGTPMTAADVIWSLQRGQDVSSQWYAGFTLVNRIEQTGEHQVTVHFDAPDLSFRELLSGGAGAIIKRSFGEAAGPALGTIEGGLMCTGPYQLAPGGWLPGSEIVTTANERYWAGTPRVATLRYLFVDDTSTLTTALIEGEIDGALNVPAASRNAFAGSGSGTLILGPSTASYSFGPATDTGPAANPQVRLALSLAIDRQQFIDTVLNGLGETQKAIVPPFAFSQLAAREIYQAGYDQLDEPITDIDRAKQLLAESGEDLSQPLVIAVTAGSKLFQQTAQIIQAAAKDIGLTVDVQEMQAADFGALFYDPSGREGIDFVATEGYLETPGVLSYPTLFILPEDQGGFFNWSGYANEEVTSHLHAARTASDERTIAEEFVAAQALFTPDALQVTLAGAYQLSYLNDQLTGITTSVAVYSSPWALHLGAK